MARKFFFVIERTVKTLGAPRSQAPVTQGVTGCRCDDRVSRSPRQNCWRAKGPPSRRQRGGDPFARASVRVLRSPGGRARGPTVLAVPDEIAHQMRERARVDARHARHSRPALGCDCEGRGSNQFCGRCLHRQRVGRGNDGTVEVLAPAERLATQNRAPEHSLSISWPPRASPQCVTSSFAAPGPR